VSFHNVAVPPPKSPLEDLFDFLEEPQMFRFEPLPRFVACRREGSRAAMPYHTHANAHACRETDAQEVYLTLQLLGNNGKPLIPETTVPRIQYASSRSLTPRALRTMSVSMMSAPFSLSLSLLVLIALALFVVVLYVSRMCAWRAQLQSTRMAALAH
jgi:hypothetical protein